MRLRGLLCLASLLAASRATAQPAVDRYGVPLPSGAVARFGKSRLACSHVARLAFFPDGKQLAVSTRVGVRVWDVATGRLTRHAHLDAAGDAELAIAPDGTFVLHDKEECRVVDPKTGKVRACLRLADYSPSSVVFAAGGKTMAVYWFNGPVTLHDLSGEAAGPLRQLPDAGSELALSPDGALLASAVGGKEFVLWDARRPERVRSYPRPQKEELIHALCFSPDGGRVAVSQGDRVRLWRSDAAEEVGGFKAPQGRPVLLHFSVDGKILTGVSARGEVVHWSAQTGKELGRFGGGKEDHEPRHLALARDGKSLAAWGRHSGALRVWDIAARKERPAPEYLLPLRTVTFVKPGVVATQVNDASVVFWSLEDGRPLRRHALPDAAKDSWHGVLSADGKLLAVSDYHYKEISLFEVATGKELRRLTRASEHGWDFAFSPDGTALISVGAEGDLLLWDVASGRLRRHIKGVGTVGKLTFAPDGRTVATGFAGSLRVTEVASDKARQKVEGPPEDGANVTGPQRLRFSGDGRWLAAFGPKHTFVVSLDLGGVVFYRHTQDRGNVEAIGDLSPDGRWLAEGTDEGRDILVRDLRNPAALAEYTTLKGHVGGINDLRFSPDGKYLVSASADGTALVWDVRALAARVRPGLATPWGVLASANAEQAGRAMTELVKQPTVAVPLLKAKLRPVQAPPPGLVERLLADLDSKSFAGRRKATQELQRLHDLAEPGVRTALGKPASLEKTARLEKLAQRLDGPEMDGERLGALRAVEVLERIGNPEARLVLQALAKGAPAARLTREAIASLERLASRGK